jgi:glucose/arabinose dehydrogenase
MKKIFAAALIITGFSIGGYLIAKNINNFNLKDLINTIKPPTEDISIKLPLGRLGKLPQGADLESPLRVPDGFRIALFADLKEYGSPRVLTFDPNGVLFTSMPNDGLILALPDSDNDGIVDNVIKVLEGLNYPHGIVFDNGYIYVAETNRVMRYQYDANTLSASSEFKLFDLPGGGRHFTRTIKILGDKLYTSVGSSCDTCQENDNRRAAILVSDLNGNNLEVFASGLRNTVFFVFDKQGLMWGNDMGRDFLDDNYPPDELNIIKEGKDYGWPWCYGQNVRDFKFLPYDNLDNCIKLERSIYDYPAHVAPLGLTFIESDMFSKADQGDLLSVFHGSWNSTVPVGYKIVKLEVERNTVRGMEDFITGFIKENTDEVLGRPVDLIFSDDGTLFISDDKARLIYLLTKENN